MKLGHNKRAMLDMPEDQKPPIRYCVIIAGNGAQHPDPDAHCMHGAPVHRAQPQLTGLYVTRPAACVIQRVQEVQGVGGGHGHVHDWQRPELYILW